MPLEVSLQALWNPFREEPQSRELLLALPGSSAAFQWVVAPLPTGCFPNPCFGSRLSPERQPEDDVRQGELSWHPLPVDCGSFHSWFLFPVILFLVWLLVDPDLGHIPGYCFCHAPWIVHLVPVLLLNFALGSIPDIAPISTPGLSFLTALLVTTLSD